MTDAGFGRFVDEETLQYERIFPHPVEPGEWRLWIGDASVSALAAAVTGFDGTTALAFAA